MEKNNDSQQMDNSRRKFIQQSAMLSTGIMLAGTSQLFTENKKINTMDKNILSKGYAARDTSGKISPWSFERRAVGENDILIDIKFCGICHSDIHQMKGDWGEQQYPQVPGHEIAGVVTGVVKMLQNLKLATMQVLAAW